MSLVAGDLIAAARQRTFGAHGVQRISNGQLLAELTYQDAQIIQEISQSSPDMFAQVDGVVPCTLGENQDGYLLEEAIHYRNFTHVDTVQNKYTPIFMVGRQYQEDMVTSPAGMLTVSDSGGIFYPIDPDGARWQSGGSRSWYDQSSSHELHYSYIPAPTVLTGLSDTLTSPDIAREALVCALEMAILLANPNAPAQRVQMATQRYVGARTSLTFQIYKFAHPAGQRPSGGAETEAAWLSRQIGG